MFENIRNLLPNIFGSICMKIYPANWFSLIVSLSQAHCDSYIKVPLKYELLVIWKDAFLILHWNQMCHMYSLFDKDYGVTAIDSVTEIAWLCLFWDLFDLLNNYMKYKANCSLTSWLFIQLKM